MSFIRDLGRRNWRSATTLSFFTSAYCEVASVAGVFHIDFTYPFVLLSLPHSVPPLFPPVSLSCILSLGIQPVAFLHCVLRSVSTPPPAHWYLVHFEFDLLLCSQVAEPHEIHHDCCDDVAPHSFFEISIHPVFI